MITKEQVEQELEKLKNLNYDEIDKAQTDSLLDVCNSSELVDKFMDSCRKRGALGVLGAFVAGLQIGLRLQKEKNTSKMN